MTTNRTDESIRLICLVKGVERYIAFYDAQGHQEAIQTFGRWAANPELRFTWLDAAIMAQRVRAEARRLSS